ncbi:hypothetical protein Ahy_A02g005158 [Arachis hypogaea]|uniref:Transposase MuDR plant domain-containing protein n=1 Tax=Arachis hypogaea TaxID=3818 RepID=A0A445E5V3_ARAHY|nr:hypothetical protein Ahy_A02g005158 [Arachis hypogaea]
MERIVNIVVYHNGEVVRNTYEGVSFACDKIFSFVVLCTITFVELLYGLCQSIEADIVKRVTNILYRSPVVIFGGLIQFEVMPIVDYTNEVQHDLDVQDDIVEAYLGMNNDSNEEFETTYKASDEDEDDDGGAEAVAETLVVPSAVSQPLDVPPFMRSLNLDAMHAPEFSEYANISVADLEDGEFRIGMEYGPRKSVTTAIQNYTNSRGVDYVVYESEPQTFYAKCKTYGCGNFLRDFKVPYLQKLVVNIGYSRTMEEYNANYKRLQERALVQGTFYRLNESFTQKSTKAYQCKRVVFAFSEFATQRIEANMQRAGNIVVNRFDKRNEVFEVSQRCDLGHFQVYVSDIYKMSKIRKVYRVEFVPLGDMGIRVIVAVDALNVLDQVGLVAVVARRVLFPVVGLKS